MKLRKADLKAIVKECLVEILQEGLAGVPLMERRNVPRAVVPESVDRTRTAPSPQAPPALGSITQQMRETIKREAGGNRIMEEIFAHTAATTLPAMISNDKAGVSKDPVTQFVDSVEPTQIFGEDAAAKWAELAFMNAPPKSRE